MNTVIIEKDNNRESGFSIRRVEPVIAETAVAERGAIVVDDMNLVMFSVLETIIDAYNSEDKKVIELVEAAVVGGLEKEKVSRYNLGSEFGGYEIRYTIHTTDENTALVSEKEKAEYK